MSALTKNFLKGLLVVVPIAATAYILWICVKVLDEMLPLPIPGLGFLLTLVLITAIGFFTSNVAGRAFFEMIEKPLVRLPVVRLLYSSLKDLLNAFAGERKSFDRPVMVEIFPGQGIRALGFVTCERFDDPKLVGHVAVYLPQSYNFAGGLVVLPKSRVERIDADGAQFFAFIMSGGVSEMRAARTITENPLSKVR